MERNQSLDFLKGVLIIFVIMGHIILGNRNNVLSKYFIYSFHMPVFMGLSGYLFNFKHLFNNTKQGLLKLKVSVVYPFLIANLVYGILRIIPLINKMSIKEIIEFSLIKTFLISFHHLWYIWAYIMYIFIVYYFQIYVKKNKDMKLIVVGGVLSIVFYLFNFIFPTYENLFLKILLNNFAFYYFIFFVVGFYIRNNKKHLIQISKKTILGFFLLFIVNSILMFYSSNNILRICLFYIANIYSIIFIVSFLTMYNKIKIKTINFIGKNSLYIYLFHALPIIISYKIILNKSLNYYYLVSITGNIILVAIIYILNKKVLKKKKYFN